MKSPHEKVGIFHSYSSLTEKWYTHGVTRVTREKAKNVEEKIGIFCYLFFLLYSYK